MNSAEPHNQKVVKLSKGKEGNGEERREGRGEKRKGLGKWREREKRGEEEMRRE